MDAINLKSDLIYVNIQFDTIITNFLNYEAKDESTIQFLTELDKVNRQLNYDADVFRSMLQAGIDSRVLIHAIDIIGKF